MHVVSYFLNFVFLVVSFSSRDFGSTYNIVFLLLEFETFSFLLNVQTGAEPPSILLEGHRHV